MAKIFTNDIANAVRSLIGENTTSVLYTKGEGEKAVEVTAQDVLDWFDNKAAQSAKRNAKAAERAKAKRGAENAEVMTSITKALSNAKDPMSGKEIAALIGDDVTSHKVAAVIRNMENITITKVKGVNAYSLS